MTIERGIRRVVLALSIADGVADAIGIDGVKAVFAVLQARERAGTN